MGVYGGKCSHILETMVSQACLKISRMGVSLCLKSVSLIYFKGVVIKNIEEQKPGALPLDLCSPLPL